MGENGIMRIFIVSVIKSRMIRWMRHAACTESKGKLTKLLAENLEKRPHGKT